MTRVIPLFFCLLSLTTAALSAEKEKPAAKAKPPAPAPVEESPLGLPDQNKTGTLPPLTTGLSERASQAFGKKDWATAKKLYIEMLRLDPANALTLANLGAVEQQSGNLKDAQKYLGNAVAINPSLQQTWLAHGLVSLEKGDTYLALSSLSRAIHEDPTDAKAHNYLAIALKKLGWLDAAESELQRAIELNPDYANAHFNLALMYLERKPPSLQLARKHYEKAISLGAPKDELVEEKLADKS